MAKFFFSNIGQTSNTYFLKLIYYQFLKFLRLIVIHQQGLVHAGQGIALSHQGLRVEILLILGGQAL